MSQNSLRPSELPNLTIERLGENAFDSPLKGGTRRFIDDNEKILVYSLSDKVKECMDQTGEALSFERAGPREKIYFDPAKLNCGIVTCGGLCPGLNDVIRTITLCLIWQYNVRKVYGFRYGYAGLSSNAFEEPMPLTPDVVDNIHLRGGSILSSSRGPQKPDDMIDQLIKKDVKLLFAIGGDGTLKGASVLAETIRKKGLKISVAGIPKTIDNDIIGIEQSFGFSTAVDAARSAICGAHEEAKGAWNGVGLVKLMGRDSGFIAANATLANSDVNFCFVPEVPLILEGENGFLRQLEKRLDRKHHAVIVIAEGVEPAEYEQQEKKKDASGNVIREDMGLLLKRKIKEYFQKIGKPLSLKYIDPSYIIRSVPANSHDSAFCLALGQYAVHAGMSGRTNMVVGYWNQHFTHVPIAMATMKRKKIDLQGFLWQMVLGTTGQECREKIEESRE